jgi:hypothetical protein
MDVGGVDDGDVEPGLRASRLEATEMPAAPPPTITMS